MVTSAQKAYDAREEKRQTDILTIDTIPTTYADLGAMASGRLKKRASRLEKHLLLKELFSLVKKADLPAPEEKKKLDILYKLCDELFEDYKKGAAKHIARINAEAAAEKTKGRSGLRKLLGDEGMEEVLKWLSEHGQSEESKTAAAEFHTEVEILSALKQVHPKRVGAEERTPAKKQRNGNEPVVSASTLHPTDWHQISLHCTPSLDATDSTEVGTKRLDIFRWCVSRLSAIEHHDTGLASDKKQRILDELWKMLDKLHDSYASMIERNVAKISDLKGNDDLPPGEQKQLRNTRRFLRVVLKRDVGEMLKWRSIHAHGPKAREDACSLLERAVDASESKFQVVRGPIIDMETLERHMKVLEGMKAKRVLMAIDILMGKSKDWTTQETMRKTWSKSSKNRGGHVRSYLDESNNGLSLEEKKDYKERLDACLTFTRQEERIIDDCSELKRARSASADDYFRKRSSLLSKSKYASGGTLERIIETVSESLKPHLTPVAEAGTHNSSHTADDSGDVLDDDDAAFPQLASMADDDGGFDIREGFERWLDEQERLFEEYCAISGGDEDGQ